MPEKTLRQSLDEIRAALEDPASLSDEDRAALEQLHDRIEQRLHPDEPDPEDLLDQAQEAVTRFEVEHPKLTAMLNRIAEALGAMGV